MNPKMMQMLMQKKEEGKMLSPMEMKAKMGVLDALDAMCSDEMGSKLSPLKKVTVASDSPQGLESGLDKAKSLLGDDHESDDSEETHGDELADEDMDDMGDEDGHEEMLADSSPEDEESDSMSPEEIDAQIAHLMALKNKKA